MVKEKLDSIRKRIESAAQRSGRDASGIILVCAVKEAKLEDAEEIVKCGAVDIGENRIQDALAKYDLLNRIGPVRWHFIGHLQSNKVKKAVKLFDLIHSVDSVRLSREIQKEAQALNKIQSMLLQVNISGEGTKFGADFEGAAEIIKYVRDMKNLMLLGLMSMAPYSENPEDSRIYFRRLRELRDSLASYNCGNINLKHLSMGMSGDFEVAIEEGADIVRIGSALFK